MKRDAFEVGPSALCHPCPPIGQFGLWFSFRATGPNAMQLGGPTKKGPLILALLQGGPRFLNVHLLVLEPWFSRRVQIAFPMPCQNPGVEPQTRPVAARKAVLASVLVVFA